MTKASIHKTTGLTKDAGFQVGARKTFLITPAKAWEFLFSEEGIAAWLGKLKPGTLTDSDSFKLTNGTECRVRLIQPGSHIRLSWKKKDWENSSLLQVRVIDAGGKTTVSFHQDKLLNSAQRGQMKEHWAGVLAALEKKFGGVK